MAPTNDFGNMQRDNRPFLFDVENLPPYWLGSKKGWQDNSTSLSDSLVSIPSPAFKLSTLLIGNTGCGKTSATHSLIAQCILRRQTFVVLDMRGNLITDALALCEGHVSPENVLLYDLRTNEGNSYGYNPLYGVGETVFRSLAFVDVIAEESASWGIQLADTFRHVTHLLGDAKEPITRIESVFYDRQFRLSLLERCTDESVIEFWHRFDALSRERQSALALPVLNKVSVLFASKSLQRVLNARPENLGAWLDSPGAAILFSAAVDETHSAGKMLIKLFFASLSRELFSRHSQPESKRNSFLIFIDECEHFFGMPELESFLVEARKWGGSLVVAFQDLVQAPPRTRTMLLSNVGVKIYMRTGRETSALLNRDLTGDPKSYEFNSFPVGEAVLWISGEEPVHIEINAPLISDSGSISAETKAYIRAIKSHAPPIREERPPRKASMPSSEVEKPRAKTQRNSATPSLEDWLI